MWLFMHVWYRADRRLKKSVGFCGFDAVHNVKRRLTIFCFIHWLLVLILFLKK